MQDKSPLIDAMMNAAAEYFDIDPATIDTDPETPRIRGMMEALLRRLDDIGAIK